MSMIALKSLERDFALSENEMRRIIRNIHLEMDEALSLRKSPFKMIPTYVDRPAGSEKGKFMALDLGGTNFRVLSLELKGRGSISSPRVMKFALRKRDITSTGNKLFGFLARSIKKFIKKEKISQNRCISLGFTFSFPIRQSGIAAGSLVVWTKGFSASGVVGRDIVTLLKRSLKAERIDNISVAALTNDTVGTLVAGSYGDRTCDVGVIIGTGTNACYVEDLRAIRKLKNRYTASGEMIINMEWGGFDKLKPTRYDRRLDRGSANPGRQMLEKMVSGMYLGEICRLIMLELIAKKLLFGGRIPRGYKERTFFTGEYVSGLMADRSHGLVAVKELLNKAGVKASTLTERKIVKKICEIVAVRAARISAAAIMAVVTKRDPKLSEKHTIAIDGSVYEKLHGFSGNLEKTLTQLCGHKRGKIRVALTKDGSGRGAAIIAAAAPKVIQGGEW